MTDNVVVLSIMYLTF